MLASSDRHAVKFSLSPGQAHDAPEGRKLLRKIGSRPAKVPLLMDRAYEGDENRDQAKAMGMEPVVPPKKSRLNPWKYAREMYKKRNQVERLFRRLKGYRRVFSRFDKLDVIFMGFLAFALIYNIPHFPQHRPKHPRLRRSKSGTIPRLSRQKTGSDGGGWPH